MAVDEVLVPSSNDKLQHNKSLFAALHSMLVTAAVRDRHLTCDCDFVIVIKANRTALLFFIVEDNRHSCFGNASLTLLVHQVLQAICSDL